MMMLAQTYYNDLYRIIYGGDFVKPRLQRYMLMLVPRAYFRSFIAVHILRKESLADAITYIRRCMGTAVRRKSILSNLCEDEQLFCSRYYAGIHNTLAKIMHRSMNCLNSSISLCAFLSTLGFEQKLVIGKALNYVSPDYSFHAWLEWHGEPIIDQSSVKERYKAIFEITL